MWLLMMMMTVPSFAGKKADLKREVEDLRTLVSVLQAQIEELKSGPERSLQHEKEAAELIMRATELTRDAKKVEALELLNRVRTEYGDTRAMGSAQRLMSTLEVLGRDSVPYNEHTKKWFVGSEAEMGPADEGLHLVVFFEAWCPHCKREMPKLQELYQQYSGTGMKVIGVTKRTRDVSEEALNTFITDNSITYPVIEEDGELTTAYNISGIPAAAVVKDGKVIWRGHPVHFTDELIQSWQEQ